MKIYRFDETGGKAITQFDSRNVIISRIMWKSGSLSINVMFLGEDSLVGHHQAVEGQLFCVIQGRGWVQGDEHIEIEILAGQAALWEAGEWHETRSDSGLTAVVIEGDIHDLSTYMPLVRVE